MISAGPIPTHHTKKKRSIGLRPFFKFEECQFIPQFFEFPNEKKSQQETSFEQYDDDNGNKVNLVSDTCVKIS